MRRPCRAGRGETLMDLDATLQLVLNHFGGGPILHLGCGEGRLVRKLLEAGCDAWGADLDAAKVAVAESRIPGRFKHLDGDALPWGPATFDLVVCDHVLERFADQRLANLLASLRRVVRRSVLAFVGVDDSPGSERGPARVVWEERLFDAGFRKHPCCYRVTPFETLDRATSEHILSFEPAPALPDVPHLSVAGQDPPIHVDLLRTAGRQSEARLAIYTLVADLVRSGDVVLDVGCDLGGGTHLLRALTSARQVIGIDAAAPCVEYARAHFCRPGRALEFQIGSRDRTRAAEHSADIVVVLDASLDNDSLVPVLDEARRVLRPGGRVVLGVSPVGSDDGAAWDRTVRALGDRFLAERAYRLNVGGADDSGARPRVLREVSIHEPPAGAGESRLLVASVSPAAAGRVPFQEVYYPYSAPPEHLLAFERDYENPWLVRALVEYPTRLLSHAALLRVAAEVEAHCTPGSADEGAALCMRGYRVLDDEAAAATAVEAALQAIERYVARPPGNPHQLRWRISLAFLRGQLLLRLGRLAEAEAAFAACGELDCAPFSPTLGTKTVLAWFMSGWLARGRGDPARARDCWLRGVGEARRLLSCDWTEFLGRDYDPLPFPLVTAVEFLDTAVRCANGLRRTAEADRSAEYGDWAAIHHSWKWMIDERWRAMQRMEAMIRERDASIAGLEGLVAQRDAALAAQAQRLDERWSVMQRMEADIRARDEALAAQTRALLERWETMQRMDAMIAARDEAIAAQTRTLDQRWEIMQRMDAAVAARDAIIAQQQALLAARQPQAAPSGDAAAEGGA